MTPDTPPFGRAHCSKDKQPQPSSRPRALEQRPGSLECVSLKMACLAKQSEDPHCLSVAGNRERRGPVAGPQVGLWSQAVRTRMGSSRGSRLHPAVLRA